MKIIEHNPYKKTKKKTNLMFTKVMIAHELLTKKSLKLIWEKMTILPSKIHLILILNTR
jgi:hypothetical protein